MHISKKSTDLLPIVDVLSKIWTILSNSKEKLKLKNASKVLEQAYINNANISQNIENFKTSTLR